MKVFFGTKRGNQTDITTGFITVWEYLKNVETQVSTVFIMAVISPTRNYCLPGLYT